MLWHTFWLTNKYMYILNKIKTVLVDSRNKGLSLLTYTVLIRGVLITEIQLYKAVCDPDVANVEVMSHKISQPQWAAYWH